MNMLIIEKCDLEGKPQGIFVDFIPNVPLVSDEGGQSVLANYNLRSLSFRQAGTHTGKIQDSLDEDRKILLDGSVLELG